MTADDIDRLAFTLLPHIRAARDDAEAMQVLKHFGREVACWTREEAERITREAASRIARMGEAAHA